MGYRKQSFSKKYLQVNKSYEGETIEEKCRRIKNNKEPIQDTADRIYTERKDGVNPDHDIRTDRWEHAVEAMSYVDKAAKAKRAENLKTDEQKESEARAKKAKEGMDKEAGGDTGGESTNTTK